MSSPRDQCPPVSRSHLARLALVLALGTVLAYASVRSNAFVNYDDDVYVTANPQVLRGWTRAGLSWAMTTSDAGNWHPITWMSHMLDIELFGPAAGGHHATSLALHALNGALLFVFLALATRRIWPAFLAAALFAWHPLRVESVAWVAERKDVLSGLFFLATLCAYAKWRSSRGVRVYALLAIALALGLMSKPMLVTVPFLLLLLDHWPLGRQTARASVGDKVPLLALVIVSSIVTVIVQSAGGAVVELEGLTPWLRVENALGSIGVYLRQAVWPTGLACFYPHARAVADDPARALLVPAAIGAALLIALSAWALVARKRRPYLFVGWFWFVGMLVPVIGLMQVGSQAHADRYTYLPMIGLAIAAAFGLADVVRARPRIRVPVALASALVLGLLLALTSRQVSVWKDDRTLYGHALRVTDDNHLAHANLGWTLMQAGELERAAEHLVESVRINPADLAPRLNLGNAQLRLGRLDEARATLEALVLVSPNDARVHSSLGEATFRAGDLPAAALAFGTAVRLRPDHVPDRVNLGLVFVGLNRSADAIASFKVASEIAPEDPDPHFGLSQAALVAEDFASARTHALRALELAPAHADARRNLRIADQGLRDAE